MKWYMKGHMVRNPQVKLGIMEARAKRQEYRDKIYHRTLALTLTGIVGIILTLLGLI